MSSATYHADASEARGVGPVAAALRAVDRRAGLQVRDSQSHETAVVHTVPLLSGTEKEGGREGERKHLVVAERAGLGSEGVTAIVPADALVTRLRAKSTRKALKESPLSVALSQ